MKTLQSHDILADIEKAIQADELSLDKFNLLESSIVEGKPYADIMEEISMISRKMKWIRSYDEYPSRKFEYPFAYLSSFLKEGMKVLDAGCSIDPFAPFLASKKTLVFGVDNFSSHNVPWDPEHGIFQGQYTGFEKAKVYNEHLKARIGLSVNYHNSDMASVPFPDQYFDRVFCISVMEHLPKWKTYVVFDEWRRILKRDGMVIVTLDYVTNGNQNFNIGKILRRTGFTLQGSVTVFPSINFVNNSSTIVAGFVTCPRHAKYSSLALSNLYRKNRVMKVFVDTTSNLIAKTARKFMSWHSLMEIFLHG